MPFVTLTVEKDRFEGVLELNADDFHYDGEYSTSLRRERRISF